MYIVIRFIQPDHIYYRGALPLQDVPIDKSNVPAKI